MGKTINTIYKVTLNEGLTGIFYRQFHWREDIQKQAKNKFKELAQQLEEEILALDQKMKQKAQEKEKRKEQYSIQAVYDKQLPKGGEHGVDGFLDIEILNKETMEVTRVIHRDVFDFGVYIFPRRMGGSRDIFERKLWTEEEISACDWVEEFEGFQKGIRM